MQGSRAFLWVQAVGRHLHIVQAHELSRSRFEQRPEAGYEYFEAAGHVAPGESASIQCTRGWTGDGALSSVSGPTFERCRVALALHAKLSVIASITGDLADRSTRLYESVRLRLITRHVPFKPATSLLSWLLAPCHRSVLVELPRSTNEQKKRFHVEFPLWTFFFFVLWRVQHVEFIEVSLIRLVLITFPLFVPYIPENNFSRQL